MVVTNWYCAITCKKKKEKKKDFSPAAAWLHADTPWHTS